MSDALEDLVEALQMRISALEEKIEEIEESNESWGRLVIEIASKLTREKPKPLPEEFKKELQACKERMDVYTLRASMPKSSEVSSTSSKRQGSPLENIGP